MHKSRNWNFKKWELRQRLTAKKISKNNNKTNNPQTTYWMSIRTWLQVPTSMWKPGMVVISWQHARYLFPGSWPLTHRIENRYSCRFTREARQLYSEPRDIADYWGIHCKDWQHDTKDLCIEKYLSNMKLSEADGGGGAGMF